MRFRFTIRDLLWLTALVAMGIAWWLDYSDRKWIIAKDRNFEAACKAKVKWAEDRVEMWKAINRDDAANYRGLLKYIRDKHPDEPIDIFAIKPVPIPDEGFLAEPLK
jgi:hypothetical protein